MDERITDITSKMSDIATDVRSLFGVLTNEQLNWKPSEKSWSIAQCLDHIIKTNHEFDAEFEKIASGTRKNSLWENYSPLSGWAGNFLIGVVKNDAKKAKAPTQRIVPPSDIDPGIVDKLVAEVSEVNKKIEACAAADRQKTVVTSPFLKVFTYRLGDALTVLVEHSKRHVRQAKRVVAADGFPR
ncbi:MAG: DinB family protein [Blastocatellia bacterium]|nr:DinB family protein [Blastocatellia bacterium]